MSSAGAVRAGGAFVEIFANDSKFQQSMTRVTNKIRAVSQTMQRIGTSMTLGGAGLGAPLVLAGRQAAGFEDAVLGMRAAANLSADQVAALSAAAKKMGDEMGISPTKVANSFLALAKAGVTVEDVLGGAGRAAVEFAKVGGVEVTRAADFMFSAMNIFGASANEAVDTLVAAANASPASIETLVESFSQVGSAGANFGQSIFDVSQSLAVLARAGIVGEEAGTAVKTMLTKLVAPTDDAQEALAILGLTMADFRDQAGNVLPMQQIAGVFQQALGKMGGDPAAIMESQRALVDVFEQRGIKVMTAFANAGVEGFRAVADEMTSALPVSEQFAIMMSGISGNVEKLNSSVERMSIAFGEAVAGPLNDAVTMLRELMAIVRQLTEDFPVIAQAAAAIAAGMVAVGAATLAATIAMRAFAGVSMVVAALSGPKGWIGLALVGMAGLAGYMSGAFDKVAASIEKARAEVKNLNGGAVPPPKNNVDPAAERKPLDPEILARKQAAEQLAQEDLAFEEAQQKAVVTIQEMSNSVVGELDKAMKDLSDKLEGNIGNLGESAFNAAANMQGDLREVIRQIEAGILNPEGAKVLAERIKAQFEADMDALKKANEVKAREFGPSMGGFGSGAGMGIGARLAETMKNIAAIELKRPVADVGQRKADAMNGLAAAAAGGAPNAVLSTSLDRLLAQITKQTQAVSEQTPILQKIATGVANGGLVFA